MRIPDVVLGAVLFGSVCAGAIAQDAKFTRERFAPARWDAHLAYERGLIGSVSKDSLRAFHERLAAEPHRAGADGSMRLARWVRDQFTEMGLEASLAEFDVLLAEPISAEVEIVQPTRMTLPVRERVLEEDPWSSVAEREIGWSAYSASGEATARVVYANYGRKQDFEKLAEMGVDVRGAIVLARFGGNFRGYKAYYAELAGAAGLIMFTDPADASRGAEYPDGVWANGSTIQRGSILTLETRGDPLTPGWASTPGSRRLPIEEVEGLPKIPVQPIGWDAAREILSRMKGRAAPQEWQGGLGFEYALTGGDDLRVRLKVEQTREVKRIANVVGLLRGADEPDKLVVVGCHHDAWVYGAWDPAAGMMVVMETARAMAQAAKNGLRPKRSVLFVGWDAEEYGLIGSTEWVEQHLQRLTRDAIAYINLDAAVSGPRFNASAWPSLRPIIADAADAVPALGRMGEDEAPTVLDEWIGAQGGADASPRIGDMGGGSDHAAFLFHAGIPSAGLGVGGTPVPNYHSVYDSLHWYQTFVLPDYEPAAKLARVSGALVARLANADIVPLDQRRVLVSFRAHLARLSAMAEERGLSFDAERLEARALFLERRADEVEPKLLAAVAAGSIHADRVRGINGILGVMERSWVVPAQHSEGLWHRNLYIGPDDTSGYAAWPLPTLRRAVENDDQAALDRAVARYNAAFDQIATLYMAIELALRSD